MDEGKMLMRHALESSGLSLDETVALSAAEKFMDNRSPRLPLRSPDEDLFPDEDIFDPLPDPSARVCPDDDGIPVRLFG